eukprot:Gregarina_sp_Poly_1__10954@NODE_861_length_5941_cov_137_911474_g623_i0_p3_GENE_NODE_861_length_5941_cov_137_911474_g623_i0NODE_861_length_5941_cov_137_911474_g623_i0_p3_ORF_typecomplete_len221_score22_61_NODE_861_length_5941_cov_137_911474_g623_i023733035
MTLLSAPICPPISSISFCDDVPCTQPHPSTSFGNPAVESTLSHIQSCSVCKQQLLMLAETLPTDHALESPASVVPDVAGSVRESHLPNSRTPPALPIPFLPIEFLLLLWPNYLSTLIADSITQSVTSTHEPTLKRQNAFESSTAQVSFESTSADTNAEGFDAEVDEPEEGDIDLFRPTTGKLADYSLIAENHRWPLRQNAFEIPAGATEEEWDKYVNREL